MSSDPRSTGAPPGPGATERAAGDPRWLLLGTFVVTFDFFAINVVVPSLGAAPAQLQWVVAAFGLCFGSGLIAGSRIGDRLGAERAYRIGIALFALASLGAACAPGIGALIAARVAQGLAAALLSPQVLAVIGRIGDAAPRQRAFAGYGAALGLGSALGQLLGALLLEADLLGLGWRAVFVPHALLALAVALSMPRGGSAPSPKATLDAASVGLLVAGLVLFMLPMIEGRRLHWPWWLAAMPVLAAALGAAFWRRQQALASRQRAPLVEPALAAERRFVWALATVLCFYCGNASSFLIVSMTLRAHLALTPIAAALVFSAMSLGFLATTFGARSVARLLARWFPRGSLQPGALAMAAGHAALALALHAGAAVPVLLPLLLWTGAAMGLVMSPLVGAAVGTVGAQRSGAAAGLVGSAQWLGNALGVALLGSVYFAIAPASLAQAAVAGHAMLALLSATVAVLVGRWLGDTAAAALSRPARS